MNENKRPVSPLTKHQMLPQQAYGTTNTVSLPLAVLERPVKATQTVLMGRGGELWRAPQPVKQSQIKETEAFLGPVRVCSSGGWRSPGRRSRLTSRCRQQQQHHRPSLRGCTTTGAYSNAIERTNPRLLCLLCLSNGHGEDLVATQVLRALYRNAPVPLWTDALPLVGAGEAYKRLAQDQSICYLEERLDAYEKASSEGTELLTRSSLRLLEPRVTLPSGGFIYARPLAFLNDMAAGLFALVYRQWRRCRCWLSEKMKYAGASTSCFFVLAVGDVWPLFLAVLTGVRLGAFIGTAKSDLYLQSPSGEWLFMQPYPHRWTSDRWVYGLNPAELEAFRLEATETSKLPTWIMWCWRFWCLLVVDLRYALFLYRCRRVWRAPFLWRLARLVEAIGTGASVYLPWERWLLRRFGTLGIYVRDSWTAERLKRLGIREVAPLALNPMMDDIEVQRSLDLPVLDGVGSFYVTMLPGSRPPEAYQNWRRMLRELQGALSEPSGIAFLLEVPVASTLVVSVLKDIARDQGWRDVDAATFPAADSAPALYDDMVYQHGTNHRLRLWLPPRSNAKARVPHPFAACLHRAEVVFACAGTATEQAVGVGKPVITSPGAGPQFNRSFWEAQSRLLGPNIILADPSREHPDAVSQALVHLCQALQDTQHRQVLVLSWRQQAEAVMGRPGAADYIARSVFERLESSNQLHL